MPHARPHASAGAVISNDRGEVLIVNPTYKPYWNLPGGRVDDGETPRHACARELREELGLELVVGELLVTAWIRIAGKGAHAYFVFDGGVLTRQQEGAITLQADELAEYRFVRPKDLDRSLVPPFAAPMWDAALRARDEGRHLYVEVED
jgi:8-oxo-dGTP pyrophosphatase MutT (NUDIX family)